MSKSIYVNLNNSNSSETAAYSTSIINEENNTEQHNRATKNWKKIKEISKKEDKRPPWQMVSLSTLPKADTNSILRAKLLDASRRLRAGKNSVAIQTDMDIVTTKLMKEVNTDIQCDLVSKADAEVMTDGSITMRQEGPGEFYLTHTIAQMTEGIASTCIQTQTPTPRITSMFFDEYFGYTDDDTLTNDQLQIALTTNEKKLIEQIQEIREIDKKLAKLNYNNTKNTINNDSDHSDDSLIDIDTKNYYVKKYIIHKKLDEKPKEKFIKPIIQSWNYDIIQNDDVNLPQKTIIDNTTNHFNNIAMNKKLASMTLSATTYKKSNFKKNQNKPIIFWSEEQENAINILIHEANALLHIFDEMSLALGPDLILNDLPQRDHIEIKYLSKYWNPILANSRLDIENKINSLNNPVIRNVHKIDPSDFD